MGDYIVRAMAAEGTVRAFAAVTTEMVQQAKEIHGLSGVASAALGRTLTAAAIMARLLEGSRGTVTIQVKGDGPLGGIVAVSDSDSNVRGYVYNPQVYLPLNKEGKFDVSAAVGPNGYLNVIRDLGLKEPYVGYVSLVSGEIGEDIAYYYAHSEQTPSAVSLGVLVASDENVLKAGGFIIQLMPGVDNETIDHIERKVVGLPPLTSLLNEGKTPEDILEMLLGEKNLRFIDNSLCSYKCNCSRERMERNLLSLGKEEIHRLMEEQEKIELQCHFCNSKYHFTADELGELIELRK